MEFLEYITDEEHECVVCLDIPYDISKWQVGDSSEHNGTFKMMVTKLKKMLLSCRELITGEIGIPPTGIICMVVYA